MIQNTTLKGMDEESDMSLFNRAVGCVVIRAVPSTLEYDCVSCGSCHLTDDNCHLCNMISIASPAILPSPKNMTRNGHTCPPSPTCSPISTSEQHPPCPWWPYALIPILLLIIAIFFSCFVLFKGILPLRKKSPNENHTEEGALLRILYLFVKFVFELI